MKLTKPQSALLAEIAKQPRSGSEAYPPFVKLMKLGLIEVKQGRWSDIYHITPAGRAALTQGEEADA